MISEGLTWCRRTDDNAPMILRGAWAGLIMLLGGAAWAQPHLNSRLIADLDRSAPPEISEVRALGAASNGLFLVLENGLTLMARSEEGLRVLMRTRGGREDQARLEQTDRYFYVLIQMWREAGPEVEVLRVTRDLRSAARHPALDGIAHDAQVIGAPNGLYVVKDGLLQFLSDDGSIERLPIDGSALRWGGVSRDGALLIEEKDGVRAYMWRPGRELEPLTDAPSGIYRHAIHEGRLIAFTAQEGQTELYTLDVLETQPPSFEGRTLAHLSTAGGLLINTGRVLYFYTEGVVREVYRAPLEWGLQSALVELGSHLYLSECESRARPRCHLIEINTAELRSPRFIEALPEEEGRFELVASGQRLWILRGNGAIYQAHRVSGALEVARVGESQGALPNILLQASAEVLTTLEEGSSLRALVQYSTTSRTVLEELAVFQSAGVTPHAMSNFDGGIVFMGRFEPRCFCLMETPRSLYWLPEGNASPKLLLERVQGYEVDGRGVLWALRVRGDQRSEVVRMDPGGEEQRYLLPEGGGYEGPYPGPLGVIVKDYGGDRLLWLRFNDSSFQALAQVSDMSQWSGVRVRSRTGGWFVWTHKRRTFQWVWVTPSGTLELLPENLELVELSGEEVQLYDPSLHTFVSLEGREIGRTELSCDASPGVYELGESALAVFQCPDALSFYRIDAQRVERVARYPLPENDRLETPWVAPLGERVLLNLPHESRGTEPHILDLRTGNIDLLRDIRPGAGSSLVGKVERVDGHLLFWAFDGVRGSFYATDGMEAWRVATPTPSAQGFYSGSRGLGWFNPGSTRSVLSDGQSIFHAAYDRVAGLELHAFGQDRLRCRGCCEDSNCSSSDPCSQGRCEEGVCAEVSSEALSCQPEPNGGPLVLDTGCGCRGAGRAGEWWAGLVLLSFLCLGMRTLRRSDQ